MDFTYKTKNPKILLISVDKHRALRPQDFGILSPSECRPCVNEATVGMAMKLALLGKDNTVIRLNEFSRER